MCKSGFLLINKPKGISSAACVALLREKFGRKTKVVHAGTLDVPALGLLILLVGKMTRASSYVMELPKKYITTIKLGEQTDTDDASGRVIGTAEWRHIKESDIDSTLLSFLGHRLQVPPNVSAVSVKGSRAYELVRANKKVLLQPKAVFIQSIKRISPITEEGKFIMEVVCSKGTYIRSLARDLGSKLASLAHVAFLERTEIGSFKLQDALSLDFIKQLSNEAAKEMIIPPQEMLKNFCTCEANETEEDRLLNGQELTNIPRIKWWGIIEPSKAFVVKGYRTISFCKIRWLNSGCAIKPDTNIVL